VNAVLPRTALVLSLLLLQVASCASSVDESGGEMMPEPPHAPGGKFDSVDRSPLWSLYVWNYDLSAQDRHDKYCKMAVSPFTFYRGSNHLFWEDLAGDERLEEFGSGDTRTWLQGDLHAYNFGSFENDQGDAVYGLNDFDESLVADYQYDLWRMAASMVLLAEQNSDLDDGEQRDFVDSFTEAYLDAISDYRGNQDEESREFDENETYQPLSGFLDDVEDDMSRKDLLKTWTNSVDGVRTFDLDKDKLGAVTSAERSALNQALVDYQATVPDPYAYDAAYFEVKDVARRLLAGTGSLGTPRFYVLIEGETNDKDDDQILDVKQQSAPTPWWFLPYAERVQYDQNFSNHAARHAIAMNALVANPDPLQGWTTLGGTPFSVRSRSIYKESFPTDELTRTDDYQSLAEQWGIVLATAHARADRDFDDSLVSVSVDQEIHLLTDGNHAEMRALVRNLAFAYSAQVNDDYALFVDWLAPSDCPAP
jgi:uncharacterized protein (DUF2252 family)